MFASYLPGLHGHVEDALLIRRAKHIDFDAGCYVDYQLIFFAGIQPTFDYFCDLDTAEALEFVAELEGYQRS